MTYDAEAAAAFYDEYGEREWTRFEDGRTPQASLATHLHYLRSFVHAGDRLGHGRVAIGRHHVDEVGTIRGGADRPADLPDRIVERPELCRPRGELLVAALECLQLSEGAPVHNRQSDRYVSTAG